MVPTGRSVRRRSRTLQGPAHPQAHLSPGFSSDWTGNVCQREERVNSDVWRLGLQEGKGVASYSCEAMPETWLPA